MSVPRVVSSTSLLPRRLPLVDEVLDAHSTELGTHFAAYRNHVCRVVSLCEVLAPLSDVDRRHIQIAACFHDLGIWTAGTFDYLAPSCALARRHLEERGRAEWIAPVSRIIDEHHKIRRTRDRLAECFRRADWIDVTMGALRFGVPRGLIRDLQAQYPNEGFHALLVGLTWRRTLRRPWSPLPMLRW
ncbi:MAG: HD domain-containing protein [Myxococcota bacterium]|nr:HD domain-containing protein [Myxococcota bacterium]